MNGLGLLRHVGLVSEYSKARDHKPEAHQCDACANPGEKRPLLRQIVPQVNRWLCFDGRIHFDFNPSDFNLHCRSERETATIVLRIAQSSGDRTALSDLIPRTVNSGPDQRSCSACSYE